MAIEIERKFLVESEDWRARVEATQIIRQGYLSSAPERAVRVRLKGDKGVLTVKGLGNGVSRPEFEYIIPVEEALALLELCEQPLIEKIRHIVPVEHHVWEIDVFSGVNAGLVVAEIELETEEEVFERPSWLGKEVTDDSRYFNVQLARCPFSAW